MSKRETTSSAEAARFRAASLGYLAFRLSQAFDRALERALQPYGVGVGQFRILMVLWEAGPISQSDIARHIGIAQPTVKNTLNRMERDGLVTLSADPRHGRRVLVKPTGRARGLREALVAEAERLNATALASIPGGDHEGVSGALLLMARALEDKAK